MLNKNDLVILKALFNQELYAAVKEKNINLIEEIINENYDGEYYDSTVLNLEYIYNEVMNPNYNYDWAL